MTVSLFDKVQTLARQWGWTQAHLQTPDAHKDASAPRIEAFLQTPVSEFMIPRSDIAAVSTQASFDDVVKIFLKTGFQWLPVFRGTLDTIAGIISVHCILSLHEADHLENKWYRHMNTPLFCPPSMAVAEALRLMHNPHKAPMIFVVDEYGGIEGLLTKWQVMKGFFHLFSDDLIDEEEQMILARDPVPLISGRMDFEAFKDEFCCPDLLDNEMEGRVHTLGGWICAHLGRVPLTGEVIVHPSGFRFEIRQATPRKIHQIAVIGTPQPAGSGTKNENT